MDQHRFPTLLRIGDCFHDILWVCNWPLGLGVDDSIMQEIAGKGGKIEHHCNSIEQNQLLVLNEIVYTLADASSPT